MSNNTGNNYGRAEYINILAKLEPVQLLEINKSFY